MNTLSFIWRRALLLALLSPVVLGGACAAAPERSAPAAPELNVLFVGNSFTYYNDSLHNHLRDLVRSAYGEAPGRMRILTLSGGRLAEHLPGIDSHLSSTAWDWVIFQGHSREAYDGDVAQFHDSAKALADAARKRNAQPALFMTWAYSDAPEMTGVISSNYRLAGGRAAAPVVPVGLAFERATRELDTVLRHDDRRHPTLAGTYLAACVFFTWLYDQSAAGLSYTAGLDPAVAAALQRIATETVRNFSASQSSS